jgi:mannose-6-phosphate isomerase-like protein (cupin superfamily)
MVKAVDIKAALAPLPVLHGRTPYTQEGDSFATLADYRDGAVFAGSFDGDSEWERHRNGDELVQVLDGETTMTILTDHGPTELTLSAGMLTVVPQGLWHRFHAPDGVTLMTVTPQPTDHSTAEDPRDDGRDAGS